MEKFPKLNLSEQNVVVRKDVIIKAKIPVPTREE